MPKPADPIRKVAWLIVLATGLLTATGWCAVHLLPAFEPLLHLFAIVAAR